MGTTPYCRHFKHRHILVADANQSLSDENYLTVHWQVGRTYLWGTLNVPEFGSFPLSFITMFRLISGDG